MLDKIIKYTELVSMDNLSHNNIDIQINEIAKIELSKRLDLIKIDTLAININCMKVNNTELCAKYTISAIGDQKCVISLKPVKFNIKKIFDIRFLNIKNIDLSKLDNEFVEPIYNNNVDFSEVGIQMVASFLDPYPKINNGDINIDSMYANEDDSRVNKKNPFEVLNNIKK